MNYGIKDVIWMMRIYHRIESEAEKFLSISAFAMKNKDFEQKSAESTLKAIEEYKKLPEELRKDLEKDKNNYVSKIVELERLCKKAFGE